VVCIFFLTSALLDGGGEPDWIRDVPCCKNNETSSHSLIRPVAMQWVTVRIGWALDIFMKIHVVLMMVMLASCATVQEPDAGLKASTFVHPSLPITVTVSTSLTPDSCEFSLVVVATNENHVVYRDSGQMAPLHEKTLHDLGKKNFRYDLNFDGHKEFFLEYNNPMHYTDCLVYVFDSGRIVKQRLQFSEITLNPKEKRFTCSRSNGFSRPPDVLSYEYTNECFRIVSIGLGPPPE
jgi:hypothetical protein